MPQEQLAPQVKVSTLATANYDSLMTTQKSSLWEQLCQRIPDIRNAAQYYVHDIQKMSKLVVQAATTRDAAGNAPAEESSALAAAAELSVDREVHYQPAPSVEVAINVRKVSTATLNSTGDRCLLMCIDSGFAAFEMTAAGVFELAVDLMVPNAPVVDIAVISRTKFVIATADAVMVFDTVKKKYSEPVKVSGPILQLKASKKKLVVATGGYSQLLVMNIETDGSITEERSIIVDGPECALSGRWLAFRGLSDSTVTRFSNKVNESAAESVAKSVSSGLSALKQGIWGKSPGLQPTQTPLGTVVIQDLETGLDLAEFVAHNHAIACMQWDETGTLLATASTAGTTVNVYQLMPTGFTVTNDGTKKMSADVVLMYRLCRGMTTATVVDIAFGPQSNWIGFSTAIGTCHLFMIPVNERELGGRRAAGHAASQLMAQCRARSAPSATPVNPQLLFLPHLSYSGDDATSDIVLASTTGMVSLVRLSGDGAKMLWTKYIDDFSGALENTASGATAAATTASASTGVDDAWRANIELTTHPSYPTLHNFTIPGVRAPSPDMIPSPAAPARDSSDDGGGASSPESTQSGPAAGRPTDEWDLADD